MNERLKECLYDALSQFEEWYKRLETDCDSYFNEIQSFHYGYLAELFAEAAQNRRQAELRMLPEWYEGFRVGLDIWKRTIRHGMAVEAAREWGRWRKEAEEKSKREENLLDLRSEASVYGGDAQPSQVPATGFPPQYFDPIPATMHSEHSRVSPRFNFCSSSLIYTSNRKDPDAKTMQSHLSDTSSFNAKKYRHPYLSPIWSLEEDEKKLSSGDRNFKEFDFPRRCEMLGNFHKEALEADIRLADRLYDSTINTSTKYRLLLAHKYDMEDFMRQGAEELRSEYEAWKLDREFQNAEREFGWSSASNGSTPRQADDRGGRRMAGPPSSHESTRSSTPLGVAPDVPSTRVRTSRMHPQISEHLASAQTTSRLRPTTTSRKASNPHPYNVQNPTIASERHRGPFAPRSGRTWDGVIIEDEDSHSIADMDQAWRHGISMASRGKKREGNGDEDSTRAWHSDSFMSSSGSEPDDDDYETPNDFHARNMSNSHAQFASELGGRAYTRPGHPGRDGGESDVDMMGDDSPPTPSYIHDRNEPSLGIRVTPVPIRPATAAGYRRSGTRTPSRQPNRFADDNFVRPNVQSVEPPVAPPGSRLAQLLEGRRYELWHPSGGA